MVPVGIAGEDDLDAPDLATPANMSSEPQKPKPTGNGRLNSGQVGSPRRGSDAKPAKLILGLEASVELRDRFLAELSDLGSSDEMATWSHRRLAEKNRLTGADAERVEEAFRARLVTPLRLVLQTRPRLRRPRLEGCWARMRSARHPSRAVNKSLLALPEPRRVRDRDHDRAVAKRPCLICGRRPADAHHLRFAQSRALGRKVSDEFTVPLCRGHHRELHRRSDEAGWWREAGIDATAVARALWPEAHPLRAAQDESRVMCSSGAGLG